MKSVLMAALMIWGSSAFASLPSDPLASVRTTNAQARISVLLEHFADRHPELNLHILKAYEIYRVNDVIATQVLNDLTTLDVMIEQNQPDLPEKSLRSLSCSRIFCMKEEQTDNSDVIRLSPMRASCPQILCAN